VVEMGDIKSLYHNLILIYFLLSMS
jgi:hypothetical protein